MTQSLGQYIRKRRSDLGLTQQELADRLGEEGVGQAEISRLERDQIALPRRRRMERLASALEVPLGALLANSGWTGVESEIDIDAPTNEKLRATIEELRGNNVHLRTTMVGLLRENAKLLGFTADLDHSEISDEARRHLGGVLNEAEDAVVVVDGQGRVIIKNDTYTSLFSGNPIMIDMRGDSVPAADTPIQRAARRERFSLAFGLNQYGYTTWHWAEGKPMTTNEGHQLGVVTIRKISDPR